MPRVRVAILGASGLVSQRMQQRLSGHPWFELSAVAGQSPGLKLSEIEWRLDESRPPFFDECDIEIVDIHDANLSKKLIQQHVRVVFSALPSEPAMEIEAQLVDAGLHVFSNASAYRMHPEVPLVVADVNPEALVRPSGNRPLHACSTNCTLIPILHPLSDLSKHYEITKVVARSQQALSGAGWKLLLDSTLKSEAIGQEVPGEAEKIIEEIERILHLKDVEWDVQCLRVDEQDGHIVHVEVHLNGSPTFETIESMLSVSDSEHHSSLPSQPMFSMTLTESEPSRKEYLWNGQTIQSIQPSVDLKAGMTTTVQLKSVEEGVVSFTGLSHNTIRGAAGGVVLLAELAHFNKFFEQ
jgi:aspartate-semialdehyde dehydrogenase